MGDPGAGGSDRLRAVEWNDPQDLQRKLLAEIVTALQLEGPDDELGFEHSLRWLSLRGDDRAFFWNRFGDNPGAAGKVEAWQVLSPIRGGMEGVDAINRAIQQRFRSRWRAFAEAEGWKRTVPKPLGPQSILYGDKVINVINQRRRDVYPPVDGEAYVANGDLGIVVGQYKTKKFKGLPWKLEVEFAGQLGTKYGFGKSEFGDEAPNPLELAYALTVHKTQGSEFGTTFVVLPNPCSLLSRELLYTALTRHRDKLVVLHQGPLVEFRRYGGEEHSEIARRMTNLFTDPRPQEVIVANETRFLERGLVHRTERGELVRSKSELVIADKLHARGIDYQYEQPLPLSGRRVRYPDFTIADHARGITIYWEHLGMLDDPGYRRRWERKRKEYIAAGILPWEEGGQSPLLALFYPEGEEFLPLPDVIRQSDGHRGSASAIAAPLREPVGLLTERRVRTQPVVLEQAYPHQRVPGLVPFGKPVRLARQAVQPVTQHPVLPLHPHGVRIARLRTEAVPHLHVHNPVVLAPLDGLRQPHSGRAHQARTPYRSRVHRVTVDPAHPFLI